MPPTCKIETIKKRKDFLAIANDNKKWVTPGLILQIGKRPDSAKTMRYGLTISKRVGISVKRNRARRRLRALAREILTVHALPEYDYVLVARPMTVTRSYSDLKTDLKVALKKLRAWQD